MTTAVTHGPLTGSGTTGHTATVLAYLLSLATADPAQASRIRQLVGKLDDISADRQMAARMNSDTTGGWFRDLVVEERATWRALRTAAGIQYQEDTDR